MQAYGTTLIAGATLAVSLALMYAVKLIRTLRVSDEGEREGGLDIHEHGQAAYPEFVVNRGFSPYSGLPASFVSHEAVAKPVIRTADEGASA